MVSDLTAQNPTLSRFRAAVAAAYGDRLERVVLFGSRARGDARAESDYDVAVFLYDMGDLWDELRPLSDLTTDILVDTGEMISAKPFRAGSYSDGRPLMQAIRRDGLEL
jgi:predicted nucleotidyltransferase